MKRGMIVVLSILTILAGCGDEGISLEGEWKGKYETLDGKVDEDQSCMNDYKEIIFTTDTVEMDGQEYSYQLESKNKYGFKRTDSLTKEVKHYTLQELKNGNILISEKDMSLGCELEKK